MASCMFTCSSRSPTVPSRATPSLLVHPCPTRSVNAPLSSHPLFCPFCTHRTRHRASYYFKHHTLTVCATGSRSSSTDLSVSDSLDILNLDSAAATDAAELRKAYYGRMREIHPDVNPELDTTQSAALVNAAYAALLKVCHCQRVRPDYWRRRKTLTSVWLVLHC